MTVADAWPSLPLEEWQDTYATLHLWLQIVGKIRLVQTPWLNHGWHITLYTSATGLTTSFIPYESRAFEITFDFIAHRLKIQSSDGRSSGFALEPQSVATFYRRLFDELASLDFHVKIYGRPNEIPDPISFEEDETHSSYDAEYANRFWRILVQAERVFTEFRARFIGKNSPVHLFWGGPDLAVTRFSGRSAPLHPGGIPNLPDWVTREAYSQEVSSAGFWAGGPQIPYPSFYSYAYPAPAGYSEAKVAPSEAFYSQELGEFFLAYDAVRMSASPDETLLKFLQTTYEAAADLGNWDRKSLERQGDPKSIFSGVETKV